MISIKIEKELLVADDSELLEDLIVAAVNDGIKRSRDLLTEEMTKITGGLRIPGLTP
jgi:nucleoid-associated protein EbfC